MLLIIPESEPTFIYISTLTSKCQKDHISINKCLTVNEKPSKCRYSCRYFFRRSISMNNFTVFLQVFDTFQGSWQNFVKSLNFRLKPKVIKQQHFWQVITYLPFSSGYYRKETVAGQNQKIKLANFLASGITLMTPPPHRGGVK